jgi:hypothetical protein
MPKENQESAGERAKKPKLLHLSARAGRVFNYNEARRVKEEIFRALGQYETKGIKYPLVVIICLDIVERPLVTTDDIETVLLCRGDGLILDGTLHKTNDVKYQGLYFEQDFEKKRYLCTLSGVALWRQKFYENPNVDKTLKIPQGRLLDFLKKS